MNVGGVVLEETTPIRREMFHHRMKVINQTNMALLFCDFLTGRVDAKQSPAFLLIRHTSFFKADAKRQALSLSKYSN